MREKSFLQRFFGHLHTVGRHRRLVRRGCFRLGLYWQGITHDLSKYSPAEFNIGVRYWRGNRSPNAAEREECGYSTAWMHHKGRNRHHFEYWTELNMKTMRYEPVPMPDRYLAEMVMDRIAASKTYMGSAYTDQAALQYLERSHEETLMHPETAEKLCRILELLASEGETAVVCYMRDSLLHKK